MGQAGSLASAGPVGGSSAHLDPKLLLTGPHPSPATGAQGKQPLLFPLVTLSLVASRPVG